MLIDIHCHLDLLKNIKSILERAREKNVLLILTNGINLETNEVSLNLSKEFSEVESALGLYPIDAIKLSETEIENILNQIEKNRESLKAIGEVGLDLKEDKSNLEKQIKVFKKMISISLKLNKPLIVHSRKAEKEAIEILEESNAKKVIMHCFSGNMKLVERIIQNKWFFSIPTNITFSEHFQKLVVRVPIEQLFCETDSPFLHPVKGLRNNEPANVIESYKKISEIKKISLTSLERIVEKNYKSIF